MAVPVKGVWKPLPDGKPRQAAATSLMLDVVVVMVAVTLFFWKHLNFT